MTVFRRHKVLTSAVVLFALVAAITTLRSFRFKPDPSADAAFIARAQQKSVPGIKVRVSALGASESQRSFGEDFAKFNIQPVWLENLAPIGAGCRPGRWLLHRAFIVLAVVNLGEGDNS